MESRSAAASLQPNGTIRRAGSTCEMFDVMVYCGLSPYLGRVKAMRVVLPFCCLVLVGCSGKSEPARSQAPDIAGKLSALKSACEGRAQSLKRKGIDGRVKYEEVRGAVAGCVGYLSTAIQDGGGNEATIKE